MASNAMPLRNTWRLFPNMGQQQQQGRQKQNNNNNNNNNNLMGFT